MTKLRRILLVAGLTSGLALAALILIHSRHFPLCVSLSLVGFTNVDNQPCVVMQITNEGEEAIYLESGVAGPRCLCEVESASGWTQADPAPFAGGPTLLGPSSNLVFRALVPGQTQRVRFGIAHQSAALRLKVANSPVGRWLPRPLLQWLPGPKDYEYSLWSRPPAVREALLKSAPPDRAGRLTDR